jgi:ParB/RepB/Spo0J family partition protein
VSDPKTPKSPPTTSATASGRKPGRDLGQVPIGSIFLGPNVRVPDADGLKELAASVKESGILEPVLVVGEGPGKLTGGKPYALVAGFRRVAAAKLVGLSEVPARLLDLSNLEVLEVQLVENLQREGLNEVDEARGFQRYLETVKGSTQEVLAKRIGKAPSYVSNRLRLLKLQATVLEQVEKGKLSASHAEVIASAPEKIQASLGRKAQQEDLSVRELEEERSYAVQRARMADQNRKDLEARVKKAKFPVCPKCKRPPTPSKRSWSSSGAVCSNGHDWDLSTGTAISHGYGSPSDREAKPTLPKVTEDLRLKFSDRDLVAFVLGHQSELQEIRFDSNGKKAEWSISGECAAPSTKLPSFEVRGKKAVLTEVYDMVQRTDGDRKRLAELKANLESWVPKTPGGKGRKR